MKKQQMKIKGAPEGAPFLEILIASKDYQMTIKPSNSEDKIRIINNFDKIIKNFTFQNVFKDYNEKMSKYNDKENEISPQDFLIARLFLFKNLMNELNQKIDEFRIHIKQKPKTKTENEMLRIHNNIMTIREEMEKQFQVILTYMNNYFDSQKKFNEFNQMILNFTNAEFITGLQKLLNSQIYYQIAKTLRSFGSYFSSVSRYSSRSTQQAN